MSNRLFFAQVNRVHQLDGTVLTDGDVYIYQNGTTTQVSVYADVDLATPLSQPVPVESSNGTFPQIFLSSADPVTVLVRDGDGIAVDGYPIDDVVPFPASQSAAESISFTPTADLPFTNVQTAVEGAAALSTDQLDIFKRALTPYTTGGSSDDYTITPSPEITSYASGDVFTIRPDRANTSTSVTLNVNSLGTRDVKKIDTSGSTVDLAVGDLAIGREVMVYYDGTRFLTIFGRDFPRSGTTSDGYWIQYPNGTQVCTKTALQLAFVDSTNCAGAWTFPKAFNSATNLSVQATLTGATPGANSTTVTSACASMTRSHLGHIAVGPTTTTSATVRINTVGFTGANTFTVGDIMYATVTAVGTWA